MMTDQEILDNAPEGATEIDDSGKYWIYKGTSDYLMWDDKRWVEGFSPYHTRSLADLRRIVELENAIENYEKLVQKDTEHMNKQDIKIAELENLLIEEYEYGTLERRDIERLIPRLVDKGAE